MRHIAPRLVVALAALGLLAPPAGARPVPRRVARPLLRLDAGPKAAPALDLAKLPVEPGAAALCRAEETARRQKAGMWRQGDVEQVLARMSPRTRAWLETHDARCAAAR